MGKSYGFVEITGVVAAIDALDIMCKTSGVTLETWERKLGGRLATIIVSGDVASVKEAVEAANTQGIKKPVASGVIASPHREIQRLVALSASRFRTDKTEAKTQAMVETTPAESTDRQAVGTERSAESAGEAEETKPVESAKEVQKEALPKTEKKPEKKAQKKEQKKYQKKNQPKR